VTEQQVLAALSVFRGGFEVEAAQAVASATPAILAGLIDKSWLRSHPSGRYDVHELVRQYASQQLVLCSKFDTVQKNYAQYFLRFTDEAKSGIDGTQQTKWVPQVEQEIHNLRSVLKWLTLHTPEDGLRMILDLFMFWRSSGHFQEGYDWLTVALAHSEAVSPFTRASASIEAGFIAIGMNKINEAEQLFAQGLLLYQQLDATDPRVAKGVAHALNRQSLGPLFRGDYQQAIHLCRQSLALAQQVGDQWRVSSSLYFIGEALYHQGLFEQAKSSYEGSLSLCEAFGNLRSNGCRLVRLGHVACAQGDFVQANMLFKQGLMICSECHDRVGIGMALIGLASTAALRGAYHRAAVLTAAKEESARTNPVVRFWPLERMENERTLAILHAHLDDATFATAWAAGCAMSLEQTVAYALADPTPQ
jgi:tetratricopeptide (TPR) repeat protein